MEKLVSRGRRRSLARKRNDASAALTPAQPPSSGNVVSAA